MSDKLSVTIAFVRDHFEVTAELVELDILPAAIFLYENLGIVELGQYQGVAFKSDLTTRQEFIGVPIQTFANKYVRTAQAVKIVSTMEDANTVKDWIIDGVKNLKAEILADQPNTQIIEV